MGRPSTPPDTTVQAASPSAVEHAIDALYKGPLTSFTQARNELAKSLARGPQGPGSPGSQKSPRGRASSASQEDSARVKALVKPGIVPWAVNQVYWHARSIWDRLLAVGASVREAQIAVLERPDATSAEAQRARDRVREATTAHRQAVAEAVHQAIRLSGPAGVKPQVEQLTRMLETLSLSPQLPTPLGRLTDLVQPAGFEALLGVTPSPSALAGRASPASSAETTTRQVRATRADSSDADVRAAAAAHQAAERAGRIAAATDALDSARADERRAREAEMRAAHALREADRQLTQARAALSAAETAVTATTTARQDAEDVLARLKKI